MEKDVRKEVSNPPILLASQSPRRRELFRQMGISNFQTVSPEIPEHMERDLPPGELVAAIAEEKAAAAAQKVPPETIVIAADTIVVLDNVVLGKPKSPADAVRMLTALSGRQHQVWTGFTVRQGPKKVTKSVCTEVFMHALALEEIHAYVQTGEPLDKAGAYGIQGIGALLIDRIQGDFYNVVGLPIRAVSETLRQFGVDCLARAASNG